jgi:hypothetical protein
MFTPEIKNPGAAKQRNSVNTFPKFTPVFSVMQKIAEMA